MITHAEQLPIEIWLLVFRHLEAHDLFYAFQNLNNFYNQILSSNYISFYLQLRENDNNHLQYPINPYWSDSILNRIRFLQATSQSEHDFFPQFLRWHVKKLIQLHSLSIMIYPRDIPYICIALRKFHCLEYLSIKCIPNQMLLEAILAVPTLRICHLLLRKVVVDINYRLGTNSNIKKLFIVFFHNVNHSIINLLLSHMPKLNQLEICGSYSKSDRVSLFAEPLFILPELEIIKLNLENGSCTSDCFKYLHKIMPLLKNFYFNYYNHFLHETFIDYFNTFWWSIIEQIEKINININGHIPINTINNDIETTLEKNRTCLLAKNNQSDGHVNITWTEQTLTKFKVIEITIRKS
ncbi:unnamed protein product [Rotaria sordida]|uniref:F-box domain-containing protein n=1 Tax=Rotaria sordida TaxID=392033 RepID=A0A813S9R9_9BILA|nr:unnamed protein product [Rotaria sordida]CAF1119673.1 unnamed protein product [Rotaria sordida]